MAAITRTTYTRFDSSLVDLFARASHDYNPLHRSDGYARRTAYGERVAFGVLAVLVSLGALDERPRRLLSTIRVEFRKPLLLDLPYRVETADRDDRARISLFDADRLMATVVVTFRSGVTSRQWTSGAVASRAEATDRMLRDLPDGLSVSGSYAPELTAMTSLSERFGLCARGVAQSQLAALLWSSYLVGMELPGTRALFWSVDLTFDPAADACAGPLGFRATVARADTEFEFIDVNVELSCGQAPFARGKLRAFVRPDSPVPSVARLQALLPGTPRLAGKLALVVGGSRGLGAAIVQGLALHGANVLTTYHKSSDEAARIRLSVAEAMGGVELLQGDCADPSWCREVLAAEAVKRGGLDILVCSAGPPLAPLGLSFPEMQRFNAFIQRSLALVTCPMAALLGSVSARAGSSMLISSSFLEAPPLDWPHYIAAKSAAEGLVRWAAVKYPNIRFTIVRPPRLLTDMTNTPGGRHQARAVEDVAAIIVRRLAAAPAATVTPNLQVLNQF